MASKLCPSWPRCGCVVRGTLMDCARSRPMTQAQAVKTAPPIAPDYLAKAEALFRQRNAIYGNNYQRFGAALIALFPDEGIPQVKTPEDAQRLDYIIMCLGKLQRYAFAFKTGGHIDSADDLMVYAAMLREFTKPVKT